MCPVDPNVPAWWEKDHQVLLSILKGRSAGETRLLMPFVGQRGLVVETGRIKSRTGQILVKFEHPRSETLWLKKAECAPTHTPTRPSERRRWKGREW